MSVSAVKLLTSGLAGFAAGILAGILLGYNAGWDTGYDDGLDSTVARPPEPVAADITAAYHQGNGGAS